MLNVDVDENRGSPQGDFLTVQGWAPLNAGKNQRKGTKEIVVHVFVMRKVSFPALSSNLQIHDVYWMITGARMELHDKSHGESIQNQVL